MNDLGALSHPIACGGCGKTIPALGASAQHDVYGRVCPACAERLREDASEGAE